MSDHPNWKGDRATPKTGRGRALKQYPVLGACVQCGQPARHRHHVDRNPLNNEPENVQLLCTTCHGLAHRGEKKPTRAPKPAQPCITCGQPARPMRRGRCKLCDAYWRDHGIERPESLWTVTRGDTICHECGREAPPLRRGLCSRCYDHKRRPVGSRSTKSLLSESADWTDR
jgi:hypothetical protein